MSKTYPRTGLAKSVERDLLAWINVTLNMNADCLDDLRSGDGYKQMLQRLSPLEACTSGRHSDVQIIDPAPRASTALPDSLDLELKKLLEEDESQKSLKMSTEELQAGLNVVKVRPLASKIRPPEVKKTPVPVKKGLQTVKEGLRSRSPRNIKGSPGVAKSAKLVVKGDPRVVNKGAMVARGVPTERKKIPQTSKGPNSINIGPKVFERGLQAEKGPSILRQKDSRVLKKDSTLQKEPAVSNSSTATQKRSAQSKKGSTIPLKRPRLANRDSTVAKKYLQTSASTSVNGPTSIKAGGLVRGLTFIKEAPTVAQKGSIVAPDISTVAQEVSPIVKSSSSKIKENQHVVQNTKEPLEHPLKEDSDKNPDVETLIGASQSKPSIELEAIERQKEGTGYSTGRGASTDLSESSHFLDLYHNPRGCQSDLEKQPKTYPLDQPLSDVKEKPLTDVSVRLVEAANTREGRDIPMTCILEKKESGLDRPSRKFEGFESPKVIRPEEKTQLDVAEPPGKPKSDVSCFKDDPIITQGPPRDRVKKSSRLPSPRIKKARSTLSLQESKNHMVVEFAEDKGLKKLLDHAKDLAQPENYGRLLLLFSKFLKFKKDLPQFDEVAVNSPKLILESAPHVEQLDESTLTNKVLESVLKANQSILEGTANREPQRSDIRNNTNVVFMNAPGRDLKFDMFWKAMKGGCWEDGSPVPSIPKNTKISKAALVRKIKSEYVEALRKARHKYKQSINTKESRLGRSKERKVGKGCDCHCQCSGFQKERQIKQVDESTNSSDETFKPPADEYAPNAVPNKKDSRDPSNEGAYHSDSVCCKYSKRSKNEKKSSCRNCKYANKNHLKRETRPTRESFQGPEVLKKTDYSAFCKSGSEFLSRKKRQKIRLALDSLKNYPRKLKTEIDSSSPEPSRRNTKNVMYYSPLEESDNISPILELESKSGVSSSRNIKLSSENLEARNKCSGNTKSPKSSKVSPPQVAFRKSSRKLKFLCPSDGESKKSDVRLAVLHQKKPGSGGIKQPTELTAAHFEKKFLENRNESIIPKSDRTEVKEKLLNVSSECGNIDSKTPQSGFRQDVAKVDIFLKETHNQSVKRSNIHSIEEPSSWVPKDSDKNCNYPHSSRPEFDSISKKSSYLSINNPQKLEQNILPSQQIVEKRSSQDDFSEMSSESLRSELEDLKRLRQTSVKTEYLQNRIDTLVREIEEKSDNNNTIPPPPRYDRSRAEDSWPPVGNRIWKKEQTLTTLQSIPEEKSSEVLQALLVESIIPPPLGFQSEKRVSNKIIQQIKQKTKIPTDRFEDECVSGEDPSEKFYVLSDKIEDLKFNQNPTADYPSESSKPISANDTQISSQKIQMLSEDYLDIMAQLDACSRDLIYYRKKLSRIRYACANVPNVGRRQILNMVYAQEDYLADLSGQRG